MKTLFSTLLILCCFIMHVVAQTGSVLWHFDTHDKSFGNAAMADLDNDGKPEIVFSCYWNDSSIYALNAENGSLLWKKNMGGCNDAAPIIWDVDNNGVKDVILASSCNPVLTCFAGNDGSIKWQTPFGGTDSPPSIADVDGDGKVDLLTGDFAGYLCCYNPVNGALKWKVLVDSDAAIEASPALVDINQDGHPDIIVNTWSFAGNNHDSSAIYAYNGLTHTLLWKNSMPSDFIYHGAAFGDIDEDGKPELAVTCYDKYLYVLNGENGSLKWKYAAADSAYVGDPPVIADLDKDGHLDILYIGGYGDVVMLDRFGNLKWSYLLPAYESSFRGAALADINNDDTLDVVFSCSNGILYALNGSRGNLIWSKDLAADYGNTAFELEQGPLIADFNNDDTLDIFVVGGHAEYPAITNNYGRAYAVKAAKGKGPAWTMFQHDAVRSNCLCPTAPAGIETPTQTVLDFTAFPNPGSRVYFNLSLQHEEKVSMMIYDMQGRKISTLVNKNLSAGDYQFVWQGLTDTGAISPAGMYVCQIHAGHRTSEKKIVLRY